MLKDLHRVWAPSRRAMLRGGAAAGAGLVVAFNVPGRQALGQAAPPAAGNFATAFVRIGADNTVTVIAKHLEMGQGTYTGLATVLAEELDADWSTVRVESAPSDPTKYNNLSWGPVQGTGGSSSLANSFMQLRKAGATARAMLVSAAARMWGVKPEEVTVANSVVSHTKSKRKFTFGQLAVNAAGMPVPADPKLKDPKDWKLIGSEVPRRVDSKAKTTGAAQFAIDVRLPGMLTAIVARPPLFGATVAKFDAAKAKAVQGVRHVVQIPSGVAVVADNTWAAMKGREALTVQWDDSKAEKRGSKEILAEYRALGETAGPVAKKEGDVAAAFAGAAKTIDARFDFPYLAHAPMEPLDAVVRLTPNACEIWAGHQIQTLDQAMAAGVLGLKPEQVKLNTTLAGGSFRIGIN